MVAYLRGGGKDAGTDLEAEDEGDAVGKGQRFVPLRFDIAAGRSSVVDQGGVLR